MAISWCIFNKSAGNKMTTGGSDMELKTEILIIGGGASGLAAALAAAKECGGQCVTVLERLDRVGKKLLADWEG